MKVAILARVSSKSDRQDYQRQIDELTRVAKNNNWEIVRVVTAKVSATKTRIKNRDDIKELEQLIESKSIDKVLVSELTRIGRMSREINSTLNYLEDNNISLYIHSLNLDTDSSNEMQKAINKIIMALMAEIAEMETKRLSQRIKSGLEVARKNGVHLGRKKGQTKSNEKLLSDYPHVVKSLRTDALSLRKTAKLCNVSVNTVMKVQKAMQSA